MKAIWKYTLRTTDTQIIEMPQGADILCVQTQFDIPCLWVLVDPSVCIKEDREIAIYGTGNPVPSGTGKYIGTYQSNEIQDYLPIRERKGTRYDKRTDGKDQGDQSPATRYQ